MTADEGKAQIKFSILNDDAEDFADDQRVFLALATKQL